MSAFSCPAGPVGTKSCVQQRNELQMFKEDVAADEPEPEAEAESTDDLAQLEADPASPKPAKLPELAPLMAPPIGSELRGSVDAPGLGVFAAVVLLADEAELESIHDAAQPEPEPEPALEREPERALTVEILLESPTE